MSEPRSLEELRRRLAALEEALREPRPAERERVRDELVALRRDADALIEAVTALRDELRPLAERYKQQYRPPTPVRVDHLGASTYLERAWSAIAGADYERALRELHRALELAPGDARGETLLGWALMRLGRYAEARAALEAVLAREPEHSLALASLGFVRLREGRLGEAQAQLERAIAAGTDRTATLYAHLYLGMVHVERGEFPEARRQLQRALELGPNLTEAYWELGRCYHHEGRVEQALEVWTRGSEANRFNPWGERCGEMAQRLRRGEAVSAD